MPVGRPKKTEERGDSREKLMNAAVEIIRADGAGAVSVRSICQRAGVSIGTFYHYFSGLDELMMSFIRTFDDSEDEPEGDLPTAVTRLYMSLIHRYQEFGTDFMKRFYTPENKAISAYMGQSGGSFAEGTVMRRCEEMLLRAKSQGAIQNDADAHRLSEDICTVVKGCVFEWCLSDGKMELEKTIQRIVTALLGSATGKINIRRGQN